jgi:hypothetical protein
MIWRPEIQRYDPTLQGAPNTLYQAPAGHVYSYVAGAYVLVGPPIPPAGEMVFEGGSFAFHFTGVPGLKVDDAPIAAYAAASGAGKDVHVRLQDAAAGSGLAGASLVIMPGAKDGAGADGALIVRQPGGVAGTDDIRLGHDGASGFIDSLSGGMQFQTASINRVLLTTTEFYPAASDYISLGTTSREFKALYLSENANAGVYLGLGQESRLWWNKDAAGYPAGCLMLGLAAVGSAAADRLALSAATITTFAGAADVAGADLYESTQRGGAHTVNNPRGGDRYVLLGDSGSGGAGRAGRLVVGKSGSPTFVVEGLAASGSEGKIGYFNVGPVVRQSHIADPVGGAVVDAECREAVVSFLAAIENYGLLKTV